MELPRRTAGRRKNHNSRMTPSSPPGKGRAHATRDEASPAAKTRQSQDEQKGRDAKQPTKQSQDQPSRDERSPAGQTRQSQDEQKGRDAKQPTKQRQDQPIRDE